MALKSKSLLVVIPAYNEEKIIKKTISSVTSELNKIKVKSKLLIVNDGSYDNTSKITREIMKTSGKVILVDHATNKGYGGAIQTGIDYGVKNGFSHALFMDSDLTNNPADIARFAELMNDDFDCVKASRYIKGGNVKNVPFKRILMSRIGNLIASRLFNVGVKDCTNGFLMIKVTKLKKIKLKERGFGVIMEEMYLLKKNKAKFKEIPVTLTNRKNGKTSFKYSFSTFYIYIKYPIKSLWI